LSEPTGGTIGESWHDHTRDEEAGNFKTGSSAGYRAGTTTGWRPACSCGHDETVPAIVLDPFCGSGTTVRVANRLRRRAIGLDLSAEYFKLARTRTSNVQTEFA
jgi:SAM-dependent methyltransferase